MTYILTFLASSTDLSITHLEQAERFVEGQGIGLNGKPSWVVEHRAADLPVQNLMTIEQRRALQNLFREDRIDVLCVSADNRRKSLLVADMDATIVIGETLDELAAKAGIKDQIAAITTRAMNGELDFKEALRERVGLLKGLPVKAMAQTLAETKLSPGAETLIKTFRASGGTCVLVSGGFTYFTKYIGEKCGFNYNHGNILSNNGDVLDGAVEEPILDKDAKLAYLKSHAQALGLDLADTMAIGDGANDLPMLAAAGLGIGYRPKPLVEESLLNVLNYADLSAVLYALGHKTFV